MDILQRLHDIGFTPLNIALIVAVVVVWRLNVARDKDQTATREAWHAETRAEVAEVKKHADECEDDRKALNSRVEELSRRVETVARCPRKDCPMR